jgi:hypothetical protein
MKVAKLLYIDMPGAGRLHTKNSSLSTGKFNQSKELSDLGSAGTGKTPRVGTLKFDVANNGKVSLTQMSSLDEINLTVQDDNGTTWLLSGCTTTNDVELNEGWMSVEMEFDSSEEVS